MCAECNGILAEIEQLTILAELEDSVIRAEIEAGLNAAGATRALSPDEILAKVKFGELSAIMEDATLSATAALESLRAVIMDTIMAELLGDADTVAPADAARAMAQLNAAQPTSVQKAVAATAAALVLVLAATAGRAGKAVAGEAARQGVQLGSWQPPAVPQDTFALPAAAAALHPWQRITTKLQTELLAPANLYKASISREEITKTLDKIPLDGSVDVARQTIHSAQGIGRNAAAMELNPSAIFASEIMDGNTCPACKAVDGKQYDTMAEARTEYEHGGYGACQGGARCRGTLVFLYDGPMPPLPPPEPLPPIPAPVEPAPEQPKPARKRKPVARKPSDLTDQVEDLPEWSPLPRPAPEGLGRKETRLWDAAEAERLKSGSKHAYDSERRERDLAVYDMGKNSKRPPSATGKQGFTSMFQLDAYHGKPMSIEDAQAGANPENYWREYKVNCTRVVNAYELRRRGYNVSAAPANGENTIGAYTVNWWRTKQFLPPEELKFKERARLEEAAKKWPDGARGFVSIERYNGAGHTFNVEKVNGELRYIEAQVPNYDPEQNFNGVKMHHLFRVDDLIPTHRVATGMETLDGK